MLIENLLDLRLRIGRLHRVMNAVVYFEPSTGSKNCSPVRTFAPCVQRTTSTLLESIEAEGFPQI